VAGPKSSQGIDIGDAPVAERMMAGMNIELLLVPSCPHQAAAENLLRTALADIGLPTDFQTLTVTDEQTEPGFAGSPTFRVEGVDLFPASGQSGGVSCRLYRSESGLSGLSDLPALRQALKRAADRARTGAQ